MRAIPSLISEAVGDNRLLNATPEHPLRLLHDWLHQAHPGTGEAVWRRKLLFDGAKHWLLDSKDAITGYKALLYALDPQHESHESDPGSGNTVTVWFSYLAIEELRELQPLWYQLLGLTQEIPVSTWQPFIDIIRDWAYSYHTRPEQTSEVMRNFAREMALSLAERAKGQSSVLHDLRNVVEPLMPEFHVDIDHEIDILYPRHTADWREDEVKWQRDVQNLATRWQGRSPETIIRRLEEIDNEMAGSGYRYPRLTPALSNALAQLTDQSLQYVNAILVSSLPGDILFPFLKKAVYEKCVGWELAVETCFGIERLHATAIEVILSLEEPPEYLLRTALQLLSKFAQIGKILYLRNLLPEKLLPTLLQHPEPSVAQAAALAEWHCDPKGTVREWLRPTWERAILNHCTDDFWLAEIIKSEHHLAFPWLNSRINDDKFKTRDYERSISAAISVLEQPERLQLLDLIQVRFGYHSIVAQLIGDDLNLFTKLLQSERLKDFHLSPIAGDIDIAWQEQVRLAFNAGYTAEEIVARTVLPVGVVIMWSGKESERWKQWIERFGELQNSEDETVKHIGLVANHMCQQEYKRALAQEYLEAVGL